MNLLHVQGQRNSERVVPGWAAKLTNSISQGPENSLAAGKYSER